MPKNQHLKVHSTNTNLDPTQHGAIYINIVRPKMHCILALNGRHYVKNEPYDVGFAGLSPPKSDP